MPSTSQKTQGQNLLSWRNSLCCLSRGWARVLPLFRLLFGFWGEMVDPCFIQAETCQELCLKMVQISTEHILCCVLSEVWVPNGLRVLSYFIILRVLSYWEFYHIQSCHKNGMNSFLKNPYSTSYVSLCNSSVTRNRILDIRTISGVATVTGLYPQCSPCQA